jgi:hypothetical protein
MELYEALGLKEERALKVVDSQKNKAKQILSVIPSLRLGNMEFRNIACLAIDLKAMSTACFGIDGFIGANLLSELIWQFDYANKEAIASRDITAFGVDTFDLALAFHEDNKKTPKVNGEVNGRKLSLHLRHGLLRPRVAVQRLRAPHGGYEWRALHHVLWVGRSGDLWGSCQ